MKSIRRRILAWMLPGLTVFWLVGGIAVYRTYSSAIFSSIDSENMAFARIVRASQRSQGRGGGPGWAGGGSEMPTAADLSEKGLFYQVWDLEGETLAKSANLGDLDIPAPLTKGEAVEKNTIMLSSQLRARIVAMNFGVGHSEGFGQGFGPPGRGGAGPMPMVIVVAQDLTQTEAKLTTVMIGTIGVGLLMVGGMALLLKLALLDGLRPLDALASAVSGVDPSSLHARFSTGTEPRELKPIVSHLDRLMDRVEKGFLRERRFGADLAHELRTPIAELRTKLDLAMRWPEERNDDFFRDAREINQRMQRVVDTMLQLANIEGGHGSFPIENVRLASMIAETWAPFHRAAREKKIVAEMFCAEDASVRGCPDLWKHMLTNIFSNAVEYTPTGGSVQLTVLDDGISLANTVIADGTENVGQMFERFWRADGSRSDGRHSGLGLSLVQSCAHVMGYHATASLVKLPTESQMVISVRRVIE